MDGISSVAIEAEIATLMGVIKGAGKLQIRGKG
jgi:hypothetical protein